MCGRFALVSDLTGIQEKFDIRKISAEFQPDWNVSPGQYIPAVIHREGHNELVSFLWGLIPSWAKDPSIGHKMINARAETIQEKPSFRDAFKNRRCLIIADGFYEWGKNNKKKNPLYLYLKSGEPFGLAGLYETWTSPDKSPINTCTIITTGSNQLIQSFHDRMPVILPKEKEQIWLNDRAADKSMLFSVLKPYPAEEMAYKVGMGPKFAQSD
jgi:putative SOS response-associated peptidase YedK